MEKTILFIVKFIKEVKKDNIFSLANEFTYKFLFALFPFLIFLMTLIGFFNLNPLHITNTLSRYAPPEMMHILYVFIEEVVLVKKPSLLSGSLLISILSASSGFSAVIRSLNNAYGEKETRHFLVVRLLSVVFVFIFAFSIVACMVLLIFNDVIYHFMMYNHFWGIDFSFLFSVISYLMGMSVLLLAVIVIYKFASCKKVTVGQVFPGAFVTVMLWIAVSKIFNAYVNHFSKYSKVYGSIGGVFILMLWLNLISLILIMGGEINAITEEMTDGYTKDLREKTSYDGSKPV